MLLLFFAAGIGRVAFLEVSVDLIVDKADDETQYTADKKADCVFNGTVILDIDHDQFKDADHGQNQAVQPKGSIFNIESGNDTYDSKEQQTDTDDVIHYLERV